MAKRKVQATRTRKNDLMSWNFIIFLTLAFILLVVVLSAMNRVTLDVRSRAGLACPQITLPRAEDCATGWVYKRDATNGCLSFFCTP
jgi:ABC-type lipoprotein release transport system permease subunit